MYLMKNVKQPTIEDRDDLQSYFHVQRKSYIKRKTTTKISIMSAKRRPVRAQKNPPERTTGDILHTWYKPKRRTHYNCPNLNRRNTQHFQYRSGEQPFFGVFSRFWYL